MTGTNTATTMKLAAVTLAAGLGLASAGPASAANITLCGASPGGLWQLLGAGLDAAVRQVSPQSTVTYQTSSGGFANIVQIKAGTCDVAIVHLGEVVIAERGEDPFSEPVDGVVAVSLLYNWAPMQWVVARSFAEEHGLESIADLATAQPRLDIVLNRRGILPFILADQALNLAGITLEDIEAWGGSIQFQGSANAAEILQDRRADAWVNATFIGDRAVNAIANSRDITLLSVPDDVVAAMGEAYGSIPFTIPAGSYEWLDRDVHTFGASAALVATADTDPEIIRLLATAIAEHTDQIQSVHGAMQAFDGPLAASITRLPYHPIAEEIFRDAGLK